MNETPNIPAPAGSGEPALRLLEGTEMTEPGPPVRSATEERLEQEQRRIELLVRELPAISWSTDRQLVFTELSGRGLDLIGHVEGGLVGRPIQEIFTVPEEAELAEAVHRRALAGETVDYQPFFFGRLYRAHLEPLREGDEIVGTIGVATDLTELMEAKAAQRTTETRFRAVFDNASDAILLVGDERRYVDVNAAAGEILGIPPAELLTMRVDDVFPADTDEAWRDFVASGSMTGEFAYTRPDGEVRQLDFSAQANVVPGTHLSIIRDVTERKRLEEGLLQSQRLEAIGRLAGGIAHDFNNLLTAISGYADLALNRLAPDDPARRHVEEVARAAARAAALTAQLLAFGRKQVFQPRILDVNDVVTGVEELLRRLIGENVVLETTLADDLPAVRVDPQQLEQVLVNLAVNARDAMAHGGRLRIETSRVEVEAPDPERRPGVTPGGYACLRVRDTGTGIAEEHLAHLFEPFFTTKEAGKGTGLGLATVYGIVKQSGGFVYAGGGPGEGATFTVYLPSVEEPRQELVHPEPAAAPRGRERILLVEDEELVRRLAQEMLQSHGYDVVVASDGNEALDLLARADQAVDLLFTDVVMPGMSGDELARESRVRRPGLPVLFASGYTDRTIGEEWAVGRDVPFVQKPYSREAIARKVREVLDAAP